VTALGPPVASQQDLASRTDVGTTRDHNEDACCALLVGAPGEEVALLAVADGVSGQLGGEEASRIAIEELQKAFRELGAELPMAKRVPRAAQAANIAVHEHALTVPELRGMTTTLTCVAVQRGIASAAHVGDSRLLLVRKGKATQLTKDHTVAAEQQRMGLLSDERARNHPGRSVLTRSLGRELIAGLDRLQLPLEQGDLLLVCSDGLHNVLDEAELPALCAEGTAAEVAERLLQTANARGTPDNLSAAVFRQLAPVAAPPEKPGLLARLAGVFGMGG
jgi:protein phosphatase